jgi:hypothetical protein
MTENDNSTQKPAAQADNTIQQWMTGARMDSCTQGSGDTWTCQLGTGGSKKWIVWSPTDGKQFSIPGSWHATTATTLSGQIQPVTGLKIPIDQSPVLLTAQ